MESDHDRFYVGISTAAQLSNLSESQIRYIESLPGITLGRREGPKRRNRVYTQRDIALLRWISKQNMRPTDVAEEMLRNQEEILKQAGYLTMEKAAQLDDILSGCQPLISRLSSLLLLAWQKLLASDTSDTTEDTLEPREPISRIVIGPQDPQWLTSAQADLRAHRALDLKDCFVFWPEPYSALESHEENRAVDFDLRVLFSSQTMYLPYPAGHEVLLLSQDGIPCSVLLLRPKPQRDGEPVSDASEALFLIQGGSAEADLGRLLLESLQRVLDASVRHPDARQTVQLAGTSLSSGALLNGLTLLLEACVRPYFPAHYDVYLALFDDSSANRALRSEVANSEAKTGLRTISGADDQWWIRFAREYASIALAEKSSRSPFHERKQDDDPDNPDDPSVVCLPLTSFGNTLGALCVEGFPSGPEDHCLAPRGYVHDGKHWLQYLMCIAESAVDYLAMISSISQRARRAEQIYMWKDTISWYWNIYTKGGLNYDTAISDMLDMLRNKAAGKEDTLAFLVIDIVNEQQLAADHQGFEIITDLLKHTRRRLKALIKEDIFARELQSRDMLKLLEEDYGDHLIVVAINPPYQSLRIFADKVRMIWQRDAGDSFKWDNESLEVSLQVGILAVPDLVPLEEINRRQIVEHGLSTLVDSLFRRERERNSKYRLELAVQQTGMNEVIDPSPPFSEIDKKRIPI
jgi:DNA-binding transcriptional MerR regulator